MTHYVDSNQAAAALGVCTKTLKRWELRGIITVYRTPGGHRRFDLAQLKAQALNPSKPA